MMKKTKTKCVESECNKVEKGLTLCEECASETGERPNLVRRVCRRNREKSKTLHKECKSM